MSDDEEVKIVIVEKITCNECGKKITPKSTRSCDQYHKKCYNDFMKRILFRDSLVSKNMLKR